MNGLINCGNPYSCNGLLVYGITWRTWCQDKEFRYKILHAVSFTWNFTKDKILGIEHTSIVTSAHHIAIATKQGVTLRG
jgi:hypothetical protein